MEDSTVTITDGSPVKATKVYLWWCCYFVLCAVCCRILSVIVLRLQCLQVLVTLVMPPITVRLV